MTRMQDLGWLLLIVLLIPLWMALALASVIVIVGRQLYWCIRGNTTEVSSGRRPPPSAEDRLASWSEWKPWGLQPRAERMSAVPAGVPLAPAPAIPHVSPASVRRSSGTS